jgi:hypothetical protein
MIGFAAFWALQIGFSASVWAAMSGQPLLIDRIQEALKRTLTPEEVAACHAAADKSMEQFRAERRFLAKTLADQVGLSADFVETLLPDVGTIHGDGGPWLIEQLGVGINRSLSTKERYAVMRATREHAIRFRRLRREYLEGLSDASGLSYDHLSAVLPEAIG